MKYALQVCLLEAVIEGKVLIFPAHYSPAGFIWLLMQMDENVNGLVLLS